MPNAFIGTRGNRTRREARLHLLAATTPRELKSIPRRCFASPKHLPRRSSCSTRPISTSRRRRASPPRRRVCPNLVVLKTLSKAFGLAGARVGCAIGNPELIAIAARALPPYPLPSLSVEAALSALAPSRRAIHQERIARIKAERERLAPLLDPHR